jgi:hypothetical protein
MAGGVEGLCISEGDGVAVETEPGNMVGPTSQGLNTRFGEYRGGGMNSSDYPPDVITSDTPRLEPCDIRASETDPLFRKICQKGTNTIVDETNLGSFAYEWNQYDTALLNSGNFTNDPVTGSPPGVLERRIIQIPVTDCSGLNNGQSTLPVVGTICFYLLQRVPPGGGLDSVIFGEVVENCGGGGVPGSTPGPGTSAAYIIQLYDDPASTDS